jgi:homoserine O-acetyltransferase/O-succinyltransferase
MILLKALSWLPAIGLLVAMAVLPAEAQNVPLPGTKSGDFVLRDFRFHSGETLPELRQHYTVLGNPEGQAVLILHGTGGNGAGMIGSFRPLFEAGAPLDAATHYIILPDAIGHGGSSKPSDGMKAKFPRYNYDDTVAAQYRLVTEGLGVKHLRLVIGNSMGGMETWTWGVKYPAMMDGLVPLASQPAAMASRNWMMRKLVIETIKADPAYKNGDYTSPPPSMKYAGAFFSIGTSGGNLGWQARAGTHAAADRTIDDMLSRPENGDANDTIWQLDAARDYDPAPRLANITAAVLAVNSADDERNPPELGTTEAAIKRLRNSRYYLIPAGSETRGHGTAGNVRLWEAPFKDWLATVPKR